MPVRSAIRGAVAGGALLSPLPALAAGLPLDVELLRPTLAPGGSPGQDTPWTQAPGKLRVAALLQTEQDPVVLYADGDYAGPAVASRTMAQTALRYGLLKRVDVSLALPVAWQQSGGALPGSVEGLALGDAEVAARWRFLGNDRNAVGVRVDVALPTGATDAWMGEGTVRPGGALLGAAGFGPFAIQGAAGFRWAATGAQDLALAAGPALQGDVTARYGAGPVAVAFSWLARTRLAPEATSRDDASALVGTFSWTTPQGVTLDVGGGPGLVGGVGAATARAFLGVAWTPVVKERPRRPVSRAALGLAAPPPEPVDVVIEKVPQPPPDVWEGKLARVEGNRILLREPVRFVFAKDEVLPESRPLLRDVASLLEEDPRIAFVVVEGHASEEGTFAYNYDLSLSRARAIYKALLEAGVHPDRLGYRAMGEVVPAAVGTEEAQLAENRRVVFRIERTIPAAEPAPVWPPTPLPWTGKLPPESK